MALTGQAKRDYQREYMRRHRSNTRSYIESQEKGQRSNIGTVRPSTNVRPRSCKGCPLLSYERGVGMSCPRGESSTASTIMFEQNINPDGDCKEVA